MRSLIRSCFAVALVVATLGACSGAGAATVQGTVSGTGLSPADAIFYAVSGGTAIAVVNVGSVCGFLSQREQPKNLTSLSFYITPAVVSTATYDVTQTTTIQATWSITDATCTRTTNVAATAGTVTLTGVATDTISGTFDLMFDQDHVSGSFTAKPCNPSVDASTAPICK